MFSAIIKKTHVLKYLHNKFYTLLLSTVFEIIPKESKIFEQGCFRHKQMLQKNLSSIRNSSSKKKKSYSNYQALSFEIDIPSVKVHFIVKLLFSKPLLYWSRRFIMLL